MIELTKEKMNKTLLSAKQQLATIRTGRANPDLLSKIMVEYYGSAVPISQMGSISAPEPLLLQINVFDANSVKNEEKAIQLSDLNLNPQSDGSTIRIRLPELTEQRRKDLVKVVRKSIEDYKVGLRNIRREIIDEIKNQEKQKDISEDESKKYQESVQKATDSFIEELDQLSKAKEAEITSF